MPEKIINDGWRAAGLLAHPSCLPSIYGIGDLGPSAHQFAKFIKKSGGHYWQILPLSPTSPGLGNSPYSAFSAFAGNPLLISPTLMIEDGWLTDSEARPAVMPYTSEVDFEKVIANKNALFEAAFHKVERTLLDRPDFVEFLNENGHWLNDYAFFMSAKAHFSQKGWLHWPEDLKRRDDNALSVYGQKLVRPILKEKFVQFLFFKQLSKLKRVLKEEGLGLIGDAAIYVNHDSSDVWSRQHLFHLSDNGAPTVVAGVPPDYFAATGQLWGNPIFNWPAHQHEDYQWWRNRLAHNLGIYDWVRLDHFRAFAAYWEVPAGAPTAEKGQWRPGPGASLFESAQRHGLNLRIIAEDLGIITPDVTQLRQTFGFPGMRVLQFGLGDGQPLSTHTPFRIEPDNAVYAATHDNNTTRGWFCEEADDLVARQLSALSGFEVSRHNAAWALIRLTWLSTGCLAVATLQDILNLGSEARLNTPGTPSGNWGWRLKNFDGLTNQISEKLAELSVLAGRDNQAHPNTLKYE